jgi:hypothetical protein
MSVSRTSKKPAVSKDSRVDYALAAKKVKASIDDVNTNIHQLDGSTVDGSGIVVTVNTELDKVASARQPNAKVESAKQLFANYRNR